MPSPVGDWGQIRPGEAAKALFLFLLFFLFPGGGEGGSFTFAVFPRLFSVEVVDLFFGKFLLGLLNAFLNRL